MILSGQSDAMYMEDLLTKLCEHSYFVVSPSDQRFLNSVAKRFHGGQALTTKQGWRFIKILRELSHETTMSLFKLAKNQIADLVREPMWKTPLIESIEIKREVRYLGDNLLGFRGVSGNTSERLRLLKAIYNNGMTVIPIRNRKILDTVVEIIGTDGFDLDADTEAYLGRGFEPISNPEFLVRDQQIYFTIPHDEAFAQFVHQVLGAEFV